MNNGIFLKHTRSAHARIPRRQWQKQQRTATIPFIESMACKYCRCAYLAESWQTATASRIHNSEIQLNAILRIEISPAGHSSFVRSNCKSNARHEFHHRRWSSIRDAGEQPQLVLRINGCFVRICPMQKLCNCGHITFTIYADDVYLYT